MALTEFDRCRTLYNKYLEWNLGNCAAWIRFAEMERALDEVERSRAILQLAVSQPVLDMPELLWKVSSRLFVRPLTTVCPQLFALKD